MANTDYVYRYGRTDILRIHSYRIFMPSRDVCDRPIRLEM